MSKQLTPRPELGKKAAAALPDSPWKEMLVGAAAMQDRFIQPPNNLFDDIWVEIGHGYNPGGIQDPSPSFGHWDLVQMSMDALNYAPEYAKLQVTHYLNIMYDDGMLPGVLSSIKRIYAIQSRAKNPDMSPNFLKQVPDAKPHDLYLPKTPLQYTHPSFWQEFVTDYYAKTGNREFLAFAFEKGKLHYGWYKRERSAPEGGFYYIDVVKRWWESGVDAGVRWDDVDGQPHSCIDASCHVYNLQRRLAEWAEILGEDPTYYRNEAETTKNFINNELWDEETGFYYDIRRCRGELEKIMTYEGFWPLAFGIATPDKQQRLLKHLFDPKKFFTVHPIPTVAIDEEKFSYTYWRGPAWTGFAYWILRGMNRSGLREEAQIIGRRILSAVRYHYEKDHTFYEYYPSKDFALDNLTRNNKRSVIKGPCPDYLGHSPLNALYWEILAPEN